MMSKRLPIDNSNDCNRNIEKSYQYCREIVKNSGSNFYYGMWLTLNKEKRNSLFAIYAWMRTIDDIADSELSEQQKIKQLHEFYQKTERILQSKSSTHEDFSIAPPDSFWPAFQQTILKYQISTDYFQDMYKGQLQSVQQNNYENFSDLYQYCYRVAASVGLACIAIWGYEGGEATRKMAEHRGIALQLTNVVRDVYNDARSGTIFIPLELIKNNQNISNQIIQGNKSDIIEAMHEIISQAEHYYQESQMLERQVSRTGSLSLRVMSKTYAVLLKKIKKNPHLVFANKKVKLTKFEKLSLCLLGIFQWCVHG